jgi:hypothetical protein
MEKPQELVRLQHLVVGLLQHVLDELANAALGNSS